MISDAMIERYLAGEASAEEAEAMEAAVAADPALEARLMALDPVAPVVAGAFAAVRPPMPSVAPEPRGFGAVAAAAAIALAVGLGGGWWLAQPSEAAGSWVVAVADYQVLYQPETVAVLTPEPGAVAAQLERAGTRVGADLSGLAEATLGGASLLRAQVLGLGEQAIIQMVYQLPDGTPLALCLTEKGGTAIEQMAFEISGLRASRWQTAGHDVLLIGDVSQTQIAALTEAARRLTNRI